MKEIIGNELTKIGLKRYYKGYQYLVEIICFIYENNLIYKFNLKKIYGELSKVHHLKTSAIKGDVNYLITMAILDKNNKTNLLNYTNYSEVTHISTKRLIEIILSKLF